MDIEFTFKIKNSKGYFMGFCLLYLFYLMMEENRYE